MGKHESIDEFLTTDEALEYLAGFKIFTSRSGLDVKHKGGELPRVNVSGRVRILYRPADLLAAFMQGETACPSQSSGAKAKMGSQREAGSSGGQSRGRAFTKALALSTSARRKSKRQGSKPNSSNVHPLANRQP